MNAVTSGAPAATTPDLAAIKTRQQLTWASGDFAVIGSTLQIVGESLAEAVNVRAGEKVLDVAAGNGNATLAAARRFANVTSTDYVPALLARGAQRAQAEGFDVAFMEADVENLPFGDATFDVVMSTYGCMFAPDHQRTASEMLRVLKPGGRLGMANWTPDGVIGQLFKVVGGFVPPPAGVRSSALWGQEAYLVDLFGNDGVVYCERKNFNFRYQSAAHWLQVFRDYYGPVHKAFAALDAAGQTELSKAIASLLESFNVDADRSLIVPGEYLEVVVTKD